MKLSVLAVWAAAASLAIADEDAPQPQIRFDLLIVSAPEASALALRPQLQDPDKIAAAQEKLLALVGEKKAQLVGWPTITTKSGNRAVVQTTHDVRYPTEFAMSDVTLNLGQQTAEVVKDPTAPDKPGERKLPTVEAEIRGTGGVPSTFDTKSTGVMFEVEPNITADGKTIEIQIAADHTQLLGFRKVPFDQLDKSTRTVIEQPDFTNAKTTTNMRVMGGQSMMLGFHRVEKPEGNVEIFILQTTLETMKPHARADDKPAKR